MTLREGFLLKCVSSSSHFQPGEGPSRGLLCDYEPSDRPFSSSTNVGVVKGAADTCLRHFLGSELGISKTLLC